MPKSHPKDRAAVERQIIQGILFSVIFYGVGYFLLPIPVPKDADLVWVLRWQTLPVFLFLCMIMKVTLATVWTSA